MAGKSNSTDNALKYINLDGVWISRGRNSERESGEK